MKNYKVAFSVLIMSFLLGSCATYPPGMENTQAGAVLGAGTGALIGQAIGGNTESTLIGLAAGSILGALVGNAADQQYQAAQEAAAYGRPVIYYDEKGRAVEAIPESTSDPNCQRVRKRIWENGNLVKETVEEICFTHPVGRHYYPTPPPPAYYYGWWGWPSFSFQFGRPYYHGYHWHRPFGHYRGWHR